MQIKYMGSADVRRLEKGEHFGGRLNEKYALDGDIEWNWENNHVINTDNHPGVDEEFWKLLLEIEFPEENESGLSGKEFKDVTDLKRIPTNAAQQTWRAAPKTEEGVTTESGTAETPETGPTGGPSVAAEVGTTSATSSAPRTRAKAT